MTCKRQCNQKGSIARLVVFFASIILLILFVLNRQLVIDQVIVWTYRPSDEIVSLVTNSNMSDSGRFYFYAAKPSIHEADTFNDKCKNKEKGSSILGCYDGQYIYIYDVDDTRLNGISEVTAAHEMLHVAYARLDSDERDRVNKLLNDEYKKIEKNNKDLVSRMKIYERTEPGQFNNELHSILATEIKNINKDLENHYSKYFNDRKEVVGLYSKYASVFKDLDKKATDIENSMKELSGEVEKEKQEYTKTAKQLDEDIADFNHRADKGDFTSQAAFNDERNKISLRVNNLEILRQSINNKVDRYNQLRKDLLKVASQSEALYESIDSSLSPAPSL